MMTNRDRGGGSYISTFARRDAAARRHKHTAISKPTPAAAGGDGDTKPCKHDGNLHVRGGFRRCEMWTAYFAAPASG